jgi:hypothetical protein
MTFIAGGYTATYDAVTIGQIEAGVTMTWLKNKQVITGDNAARSAQDGVYQGIELFVDFVLMEHDLLKAMLAYAPYGAGVWGTQGVVGRVDSQVVSQLILTAVAGTTAASSPASVTMPFAIVAEDFPVRVKIGPQLRNVPMRMRVYPSAAGVYFTTT